MKNVEPVVSFDRIKLLADPRRMEILRLLMASPATLTQLAHTMKQSPAWVRHHILALEAADLVVVSEVRKTGRMTEKFYQARAGALLLREIILPKGKQPVIVFSGSHDLALERVALHLQKHVTLLSMSVGSLDGLANLRQGLCQISGAHLLDETGEYNIPYVRHLFPDRDMKIVTLAHRTQGLMLAIGNPKGIREIGDMARPNVRFVNRNPGSGTRLWFDGEMKRLQVPVERINGYESIVHTHSDAALLIASDKADAALGLQAAAHQHNLAFIPLFEERYDLILPLAHEKATVPLLDHIQTLDFRSLLQSLTGYNTAHSGEQIQP